MAETREILATYLPATLVRMLAAARSGIPAPRRVHAVVLFADFSGYTRLAEALETSGGGGEAVIERLNRGFRALVDGVLAHGGDVLRFAGDAVLALWPAGPPSAAAAVARAVACGNEMIRRLDRSGFVRDTGLSLRVGVAAGPLWLLCPGGRFDRREFVVAGEPLRAAARALHAAAPGAAAVDPASRGARRLNEAAPGAAIGRPRGAASAPWDRLRRFVPAAIVHRVRAGLSGWSSEIRTATVLFANLDAAIEERADPPGACQELLLAVQDAIYRHEGSLNQFLEDDKGLTLLAAFGLPPLAHTDDPARAVAAARELSARLAALGCRASIGIATGPIYCGDRGTPRRRDYAMVGHSVNLAARLMQAAEGGLLCDAATASAAGPACGMRRLRSIRVKGAPAPVPVFRPAGSPRAPRWDAPMVGRLRARREWAGALAVARAGGPRAGPVVWAIEGEAGVGKSRLLSAMADEARRLGLRCLALRGEGWLDPGRAWAALCRQAGVEPAVPPAPDGARAPGADESARERLLDADLRALQALADARPLAVLIDDADRLDSSSAWAVSNLARRVRPLALAVARPVRASPDPLDPLYLPGARVLRLDGLRLDETRRLARAVTAGTARWSAADIARLHEATRGNPFLILHRLREGADGGPPGRPAARCAGRVADLARLVAQRVDRLSPEQQVVLKAAAALAPDIDAAALSRIVPRSAARGGVESKLAELAALGFVECRPAQGGGSVYRFASESVRAGVYGLLPARRRRALHRAAARMTAPGGANDNAGRRRQARHWMAALDGAPVAAADRRTAVPVLAGAAGECLRRFGYAEAAGLLAVALRLARGAPRRRLAEWERWRGQALLNLCRMDESLDALRSSAARLGYPPDDPAARRRFLRRATRPAALDAARAMNLVGQATFYLKRPRDNFRAHAAAWRAARRAGDAAETWRAAAGLCVSAELMGRRGLADRMARFVRAGLRAPAAPEHELWCRLILAVFAAGRGRWSVARTQLGPALRLARRLGDSRREMQCLNTRGTVALLAGRAAEAARDYADLAARADELDDAQYRRFARSGLIHARLAAGDRRGASRAAAELAALPSDVDPGATARVHADAALALVAARRGRRRAAAALLVRALDAYAGDAPVSYADRLPLRAMTEAARILGRSVPDGAIPKLATIAEAFARRFPSPAARGRREGN